MSHREAAARMTTARPRQGRRGCRGEILPNEESVGQRAGLRSLPFWLERNSVSSCAHRDGRGAIGVTSWRLLLRYCVAGSPATRLPCAGDHRGPVPGYSSAPPDGRARARSAWRRSPNTVLLDVRRHRRELIGNRMVMALERPSWELKRIRGAFAKTKFLRASPARRRRRLAANAGPCASVAALRIC